MLITILIRISILLKFIYGQTSSSDSFSVMISTTSSVSFTSTTTTSTTTTTSSPTSISSAYLPSLPIPSKVVYDPYLTDEYGIVLNGDSIYIISYVSNLQQIFSFGSGTRVKATTILLHGRSMILFNNTLIIPNRYAGYGFIYQLDLSLNVLRRIVPYIPAQIVIYPTLAAIDNFGTVLYSSYSDGSISSFNLETYNLTNTFYAHTGELAGLFVTDSLILTVGQADSRFKVWNRFNGSLINNFGITSGSFSVAITPLNDAIFVGTTGGSIFKYNISTGIKLLTLNDPDILYSLAHFSTIYSLNTTQNFLFSAAADAVIKQWDINNGTLICRYYGGFGFRQVIFNDTFAIGLSSGQISQYLIQNSTCYDIVALNPYLIKRYNSPVLTKFYDFDFYAQNLAIGSTTTIRILSMGSNSQISSTVISGATSNVNVVLVNGTNIFCGQANYKIYVVSLASGLTWMTLSGHTAVVLNLQIAGGLLISSQATQIIIWDNVLWSQIWSVSVTNSGAFVTDGTLIYYQLSSYKFAYLNPKTQNYGLTCFGNPSAWATVSSYSAKLNFIAFAYGNSLGYCDLNYGNFVPVMANIAGNVILTPTKIVTSGPYIFVGFPDGTIQLHNVTQLPQATLLRSWYSTADVITRMRVNNNTLYVSTQNGYVSMWNVPELLLYSTFALPYTINLSLNNSTNSSAINQTSTTLNFFTSNSDQAIKTSGPSPVGPDGDGFALFLNNKNLFYTLTISGGAFLFISISILILFCRHRQKQLKNDSRIVMINAKQNRAAGLHSTTFNEENYRMDTNNRGNKSMYPKVPWTANSYEEPYAFDRSVSRTPLTEEYYGGMEDDHSVNYLGRSNMPASVASLSGIRPNIVEYDNRSLSPYPPQLNYSSQGNLTASRGSRNRIAPMSSQPMLNYPHPGLDDDPLANRIIVPVIDLNGREQFVLGPKIASYAQLPAIARQSENFLSVDDRRQNQWTPANERPESGLSIGSRNESNMTRSRSNSRAKSQNQLNDNHLSSKIDPKDIDSAFVKVIPPLEQELNSPVASIHENELKQFDKQSFDNSNSMSRPKLSKLQSSESRSRSSSMSRNKIKIDTINRSSKIDNETSTVNSDMVRESPSKDDSITDDSAKKTMKNQNIVEDKAHTESPFQPTFSYNLESPLSQEPSNELAIPSFSNYRPNSRQALNDLPGSYNDLGSDLPNEELNSSKNNIERRSMVDMTLDTEKSNVPPKRKEAKQTKKR